MRDRSDPGELAESVRRLCLETLLAAYERAGMSGLCAEGRWEIAVAALRDLDLTPLATRRRDPDPEADSPADASAPTSPRRLP